MLSAAGTAGTTTLLRRVSFVCLSSPLLKKETAAKLRRHKSFNELILSNRSIHFKVLFVFFFSLFVFNNAIKKKKVKIYKACLLGRQWMLRSLLPPSKQHRLKASLTN